MNFREKLVVQIVICMMIFAGIRSVGMLDIKGVREVKAFIGEHYRHNYTTEEIKVASSHLIKEAGTLHTAFTSAVIKANQPEDDGEILGKADKEGIQMVYAIRGGTVTGSGIDKELGTFIKIKTDSGIETYGNLCEISAVTGDKVRKGDIVGAFDKSLKKEFIYQNT